MDPLEPSSCRLALNRGLPIPLWAQVEAFLSTAIAERRLVPGQRLGTGADLAARFSVTPATVRHALDRLRRAGLVSWSRSDGHRVTALSHG